MSYPSVSFCDPDFLTKLITDFCAYGVTVITDVLSPHYCDMATNHIFSYFEKLGTGINVQNLLNTWTSDRLPPETRPGLFQVLVCNMPIVWDIRSHPNIRTIFEIIYSAIKGKPVTDFIVSNDGINVRPNGFLSKSTSDWAHIDQTAWIDIYKCIQGQAVLTNTTAGFRASPKSFKIFEELLNYYGARGKPTNWLSIKKDDYAHFQAAVEAIGGSWQIPIIAPKGSFIIWSSATIHSAKLADRVEIPTPLDPWLGARCVVYVCYRPRTDFTDEEIKARASTITTNRVTNHWGTKIFPLKPDAWYTKNNKCATMEELIAHPDLVYTITGQPPTLTLEQQKLAGLK